MLGRTVYAGLMTKEFAHDSDGSRYTLSIDGDVAAAVEYSLTDEVISFNRTFTAPERRGQGLAAEIVEYAVNDVEQSSERKIVPVCPYVAAWFDKHPERAGVLTRGE